MSSPTLGERELARSPDPTHELVVCVLLAPTSTWCVPRPWYGSVTTATRGSFPRNRRVSGTACGARPGIAGFPALRRRRVRESPGFSPGEKSASGNRRPSRPPVPESAAFQGAGLGRARIPGRVCGRPRIPGRAARRRAGRPRVPGRHSTPVTKQGTMEISQGTLTSSRAPSQSCEGNSDEKGSNRVRSEPTTEH